MPAKDTTACALTGRGARSMSLVERQEQLISVSGAWRDTRACRGRLMLVTGGAGSGKTALLEAFTEEVHATGGRTLSTGGSFTDRNTPFSLIAQLFDNDAFPRAVTHRIHRMLLTVTARLPAGEIDPFD